MKFVKFLDFGYDWYFVLNLFKLLQIKNIIRSPKISYERRAYESVDDKILSYRLCLKNWREKVLGLQWFNRTGWSDHNIDCPLQQNIPLHTKVFQHCSLTSNLIPLYNFKQPGQYFSTWKLVLHEIFSSD